MLLSVNFIRINSHWVVRVIIASDISYASLERLMVEMLTIFHGESTKTQGGKRVGVVDWMNQSNVKKVHVNLNFHKLYRISDTILSFC